MTRDEFLNYYLPLLLCVCAIVLIMFLIFGVIAT